MPWNLAVDDLGHVTTDYFEFDLPQPWLDRVEVSMEVRENGEAFCRVTLPQQPDAALAVFRLGDPATSETAMGDIATQHAANWNNGNNQVVELWTRNWPWLATDGNDGSLGDAELAELVSLATKDALTLDQAREQAANGTLAIASYAASAIIPTVRVPLYGANGEVQGAAEPQVFFDGTQPEQPVESENPAEPTEPVGPQETAEPNEPEAAENPSESQEPAVAENPDEPENPAEPEAPAESEQPAGPEQPQESPQPADPNETEILGDPNQPAESEEPAGPTEPEAAEIPSESEAPVEGEQPAASQVGSAAENPSEPQQPAEPPDAEAPADSEQPAEPAVQEPLPVPLLSIDDVQSYQALNRLLTDFAAGYPGVAYNAGQPAPGQEEALALLGVAQVVREQATPGLPADRLVPIEVVENGNNPWGDPSLNARVPIDPVLAAVKALANVELDPALLANGIMARYDGGYLYYTAEQVGSRSGIALAQSLEQQDEATYRVTFAEYGGPASVPPTAVDANDASLLASAGADLAQRLGVDGPTPRVGSAVVRLVAIDDPAAIGAQEEAGLDATSATEGGAFDAAFATDAAALPANAQVAPSAQGVVIAGYRLVVVEFLFDYPEGCVAPVLQEPAESETEPAAEAVAEPAPVPESEPMIEPEPTAEPEPAPEPGFSEAEAADLGLEGIPGVGEAFEAAGIDAVAIGLPMEGEPAVG